MQASVKKLVKSMPPEEQAKFKVRGVKCMGGCLNACSVAVTAPKKQACLFVDLSPEDSEDVRTIITTHQQSRIGKPKLPEHLKPKFLCRIPQPAE